LRSILRGYIYIDASLHCLVNCFFSVIEKFLRTEKKNKNASFRFGTKHSFTQTLRNKGVWDGSVGWGAESDSGKTRLASLQIPSSTAKYRNIRSPVAVVIRRNSRIARRAESNAGETCLAALQIPDAAAEHGDIGFAVAVVICRDGFIARLPEGDCRKSKRRSLQIPSAV
jgi:hypothetical protein